jgi:hypothetical protein
MRFAGLFFAIFPLTALAQDVEAMASGMVAAVDSTAWGVRYSGGKSCREYFASAYGEPYTSVSAWSWHCDATSNGIVTESYYYALSGAAVLLRLDIGLPEANQKSSEPVRALIEAELTQRFGAPLTARLPAGYPRPGGGPQVRISHWHTQTDDLLLFDGPFYLSPLRPRGGVRLIALASAMNDAISDDAKMPDVLLAVGTTDEERRRLERELAPLYDNSAPTVGKLVRLLGAARTAEGNRKAANLLAADSMTTGLAGVLGDGEHVAEAEAAGRQLAEFGVRLGPQQKDGLRYDHELLSEAWGKYPNTEWGEGAFLKLEQMAWDPASDGYSRPENPDTFRDVVEHGEAFLAGHPNSPVRLRVLFAVASAYETWWSVSLAPASDENYGVYPRRAENERRGDEARLKAIADYEQIERMAPSSDFALWASRHLPRLRLRLDTGFRRWFEVGD